MYDIHNLYNNNYMNMYIKIYIIQSVFSIRKGDIKSCCTTVYLKVRPAKL